MIICFRTGPTPIQVDGADQRFHGVGENRRLLPTSGLILAFAEQKGVADIELGRQLGQGGRVDHRSPHFGQLSLRHLGIGPVQVVGDDQAEHGVTEELQPLVRAGSGILGAPGPVGQRPGEQVGVADSPPEAAR